MALVENKYNIETSRNGYPINMFQEGLPHDSFFIAINNQGHIIISPNKKTVAIYAVGELEILVWFMRTWMLKTGYCYNQYLKDATWSRIGDDDDMIGCTVVTSVSASYSKYSNLTFSLCTMTCLLHGLYIVSSLTTSIYSIDTLLYSYTLPSIQSP